MVIYPIHVGYGLHRITAAKEHNDTLCKDGTRTSFLTTHGKIAGVSKQPRGNLR